MAFVNNYKVVYIIPHQTNIGEIVSLITFLCILSLYTYILRVSQHVYYILLG